MEHPVGYNILLAIVTKSQVNDFEGMLSSFT
jgi:hypothetical protein